LRPLTSSGLKHPTAYCGLRLCLSLRLLATLMRTTPCEYLIFSQKTGHKISIKPTDVDGNSQSTRVARLFIRGDLVPYAGSETCVLGDYADDFDGMRRLRSSAFLSARSPIGQHSRQHLPPATAVMAAATLCSPRRLPYRPNSDSRLGLGSSRS
jgi:hypothetical protein